MGCGRTHAGCIRTQPDSTTFTQGFKENNSVSLNSNPFKYKFLITPRWAQRTRIKLTSFKILSYSILFSLLSGERIFFFNLRRNLNSAKMNSKPREVFVVITPWFCWSAIVYLMFYPYSHVQRFSVGMLQV